MSALQMSQVLSQRMEQKLIMTRQMIQSIEMLQLPLMDLQQNISQELTANPWLESFELEGQAEEAVPEGGARAEADDWDDKAPATPAQGPTSESDQRMKRLEALVEEWNDVSTRNVGRDFVRRDGDDDTAADAMRNTAAPTDSLQQHLLEQLHLSLEEPRLKLLAEEIIGSLDKNGYLRIELAELFRTSAVETEGDGEGGVVRTDAVAEPTEEEQDLALALVQSFEPAGVGARSLQECLLLQLQRLPEDLEFERKLIADYLDDLSHNRLPKVAKELGVDVARVKDGLNRIARLNPRPGAKFGGGRPHYVVPDVVVEEIEGRFLVRVNESFLPPLRVSQDSLDLLRREGQDSAVREYIMGKLGAAVWLLESVVQRRNTLRRIAEHIAEIQKDFFENGPSQLKPLMMQEIADRISMHVSTVSRALAGKYMQTPHGLFPMKYFFTGGFATEDGEAESNRAIMLKIEEMIKGEDKRNPLSDQEIVEMLAKEGVNIARRTVAKYREKSNILSSRRRKQY